MKRKVFKFLATALSVLLLCTMFGGVVSAHEFSTDSLWAPHGAEPVVENYKWETITTVIGTEQTSAYFILHTETDGGHKEDLYLSFPRNAGGFRLESKHEYQESLEVSNVGLFEPEVIAIEYLNADGIVTMKGTDGTIVKYKQNGTAFQLDVYDSATQILRIENGQIHFGYSTKLFNKGDIVATMVEMPMDYDNEAIYNGSQRYCDTNVVGEHFSLTNNDCFSADEYAYGNIPLFHSNRGYSIWFNMTYPGEANFGCDQDDTVSKEKYSIVFYGDKLDFFMWTGEPLENLKKYTRITGTSGMTEQWTFGFWAGATASAWAAGEGVQSNVENIMNVYNSYGFYPEAIYTENALDNETTTAYLNSIGVRKLSWVWTDQRNFATSLSEVSKLPSKKTGSTGWPLPFSSLGLKLGNLYVSVNSQHADCSNPSLKTYLTNHFTPKWELSSMGTMLDMNESMSFVGTCWNGLSSMEMHNLNTYYYAKYGREVWEENYGSSDYLLFQRSAAAGTQYYVSGFQGDQKSTWDGYKAAIRDMISRSSGGFNLFGADLGGLSGTPSDDLWNRWVVFSVFQPYMRQHGNVIHDPTKHGTVAAKNFGKYYYLRKNIVPSIMSAAMEANKTSNPIVKGMMMAYPKDRSLKDIDNQYLFCDDFMVCAVTTNDVTWLDVYLPDGNTWYNLFTYEAVAGKRGTQSVAAPNNWMPVYLKDGSVKAINLPDSKTLMDNMPNTADEHPSLLITPPDAGNGRQTVIYNKDGQSDTFREYDYATETYVNTPVDNATFTVTNKNENGSSRQTVLALGVIAYEVYADGTKLTSKTAKSDLNGTNYGYYVDANGMTTIYLPTGWKELKVVKGNAVYTELPNKSNYVAGSGTNGNISGQVPDLFDNDYSDGLPTFGYSFKIDLKSSQKIDRIVLYWNPNYAVKYTIEVSSSAYMGYTTVFTAEQCEGDGGIDICDISATGRYIRFTCKEYSTQAAGGTPVLQEMKLYSKNNGITQMTSGTATCTNGHTYGDGDTCSACGYERAALWEAVADGKYTASVQLEDHKEVKAGTLLLTNMRGDVAVPHRIGFQQDATSAAEFTVPNGFDDEGIEVAYETMYPTLDTPNIGNLGNSYNATSVGLRFVSRFSRIVEDNVEYMVLGGQKYEIVDYGMLVSSRPGLNTTQMTDEEAMVLNTSNKYVQKLSVKKANRFYDKCNEYVDMAVSLVGLDKAQGYANPEEIDFCARAYVVVKLGDGTQKQLYGNVTECSFADVMG